MVQAILLACLAFGLLALVTTRAGFVQKFVGEASAESLGAIRMLTCGILLMSTLWEDLASSSFLPVEMRRPMGMLQLFYALPVGFEKFVASEISLRLFKWLTVLILSLGVIGWRTRIVLPLGAFCYFLLGGILRQYDHLWHTGLVPLYVITVLSFTPCGDGWSVDSQRKMDNGEVLPHASSAYGWSRFACWAAIAVPYLAAGLSKLFNGGIFWWNPTNMRQILYADTLNPNGIQKILGITLDWDLSLHLCSAPDLLFALLGMGAVLIELSFVMVLISRTARLILPALAIMMHIAIFLLQRVLFFDLILMNLIFYDFTRIRKAVAQEFAMGVGLVQVLLASVLSSGVQARGFVARNRLKHLGCSLHYPTISSRETTAGVRHANDVSCGLYYPFLVSGLTVILLLCWFYRVEFYPFSAIQMYSQSNTPGLITYYKVLAHHESGITSRAYPEETIGALADGRYQSTIKKCFSPKKVQIQMCQKLLNVWGSAYNQRHAREKVMQFEVQKWTWDFHSSPHDQGHGNLVDRFTFDVGTGKDADKYGIRAITAP